MVSSVAEGVAEDAEAEEGEAGEASDTVQR